MVGTDAQILIADFERHCIICHDASLKNNKLCYLTHLIKNKKCTCDPLIHKSCLEEWLVRNHKCVICNTPIEKCNLRIDHTHRRTCYNILFYVGTAAFLISIVMFIMYECSLYA